MSGKSYTMREMKTIVDYLVEHKLYGEIRGRKMWMDFASSQRTQRTWQSLKETFLKRILPDIHNPYYKLTNEQINSFRTGYDVQDRSKNKLEIHTISDDSNDKDTNQKAKEETKNGNSNEGETTTGEKSKPSKIPTRNRSSADTIIVDNCYETAAEIQKDLESNDNTELVIEPPTVSKSLRDCITYSEPLTPMLQEVLDDFTSEPEDSDREPQMEIVESVPDNDTQDNNQDSNEIDNVAKNAEGLSAEVVEEVLTQELDTTNKNGTKSPILKNTQCQNLNGEKEKLVIINEISSVQAEHGSNLEDYTEGEVISQITKENTSVNDSKTTPKDDSHTETTNKLNNSNSTVDASLPNNPEALQNKQNSGSQDKTEETPENNSKKSDSPVKANEISAKVSVDGTIKVNGEEPKGSPKKTTAPKPILDKAADQINNIDLTVEEELPVNKDLSSAKVAKKETEKSTTDLDKPSTSRIASRKRTVSETISTETKNPCLQNVSLFDEQFNNKLKYNSTDSSDAELNETEGNESQQIVTVPKIPKGQSDPVVLKSHSDSDMEVLPSSPPKKKSRTGVISKTTDKAISNIFGFSSGATGSKRRRHTLSRRRRTISQNKNNSHNDHSPTSEWTSESEDDAYISPPRSRKNRPTRKYLKPRSARVMSLEEDGGLFVMYRKKIYPLIKDGKIVKNYTTYLPESDSDEGEAYWKRKFEEEKKKSDELKKMLQRSKKSTDLSVEPVTSEQAKQARSSHISAHDVEAKSETDSRLVEKVEESKVAVRPPSSEKIKIKFTKNDEEVALEGHWPSIHPVLAQVVELFHKEPETVVVPRQSKAPVIIEPPKEPSSGISTPIIITPVDPVHEKVNQLEKEIFKTIEELDKEEQSKPEEEDSNVTKRKVGRPRKSSSSVPQSPPKRPKISEENVDASQQNKTDKPATATATKTTETKDTERRTSSRTPRKVLNETLNIDETRQTTVQTRRSTKRDTTHDEDVRYKFPPKSKKHSKIPNKNRHHKSKRSSPEPTALETTEPVPNIISPPENFTQQSIDSTQGYQDSDISPPKTDLRKKKKLHMSSFMMKTRNSLRRTSIRKTHPYLYCDAYNDSSNSSVDANVQVIARENSSLNTEAYRSESYQLLMPQGKTPVVVLQPIDETAPLNFNNNLESINLNDLCGETYDICNSDLLTNDIGSSSNVSLPMSPELSVVENMSLSKEIIGSINYPTINEMQINEIKDVVDCNKFIMSDIDVTLPLMQQNCEFGSSDIIMTEINPIDPSVVTASLLTKIDTFNIDEQVTATDTLDQKLHDLLLDSAKKLTRTETQTVQEKENMMDVDPSASEIKKTKSKKRCSTPRKRKVSRKSLAPQIAALVEEEHVEACSHSGRKSCPPNLQPFANIENAVDKTAEQNTSVAPTVKEKKPRKKKDIIKVKIQRPKEKKSQESRKKSMKSDSMVSVNDSGINDSVFIPMDEESIDLIHNHSETCLLANECVGDSVEFIENSKSVITLGDSLQAGDNTWNSRADYDSTDDVAPDVFCNNAQDMKSFYTKNNEGDNIESPSDGTVYHSPLGTEASGNSLITEDLSDESPQPLPKTSKWYLLSEEETTNTNFVGQTSPILNVRNFPSNLKQLFPVTCTVPDLSTITETSKENEDSRKPSDIDNITGDDFNSKSIFDSNSN